MRNLTHSLVLMLLLATLAGCDRTTNERREKYLQCYNAYVEPHNAAVEYWNLSLKAPTPAVKRSELNRCRAAVDRIEPYEPLGVDPRLGDAIRDSKLAWIKNVEFATQQLDAWIPNIYASNELIAEVNAADQRVQSASNLVASEVGGVAGAKAAAQ